MSTLALVIKENQRKPDESEMAYFDRVDDLAFGKLLEKQSKKKLTKEEYDEANLVENRVMARFTLQTGLLPVGITDKLMKPSSERLHRELTEEFRADTAIKRMLIDRLVAAWSMCWSYEKMLYGSKYKASEDDTTVSYNYDPDKTKFLKEARLGIETANDQIIRLTQALQNISNPPIHVKAKNAFFAQNQQINQGIPPKDLADSKGQPYVTKLPRRKNGQASNS
jgi:hypothetical protein